MAYTIKPTSKQAIAELVGMGIVPVMLTGDNQTTAEAIARQAGLTEVPGNLLPEDKLAAIRSMQTRYGPTAMTGDGINDARRWPGPTSAWPWVLPALTSRWKPLTWW